AARRRATAALREGSSLAHSISIFEVGVDVAAERLGGDVGAGRPNADGAVLAGGDDVAAVRREGRRPDPRLMPGQDDRLRATAVPDAHGAVGACGGEK